MKSHTNGRKGWGPTSAPSTNEFVDLPSGMLVWLTDDPWVSKCPRFESQTCPPIKVFQINGGLYYQN